MANGGPDPSWPRFAVSPSPRAWPRWRWWPSTTTQTHFPYRRPPSSGQTRHRRHRRVRQETPTNNRGVYARTGTRRTTRPKIGHAITRHKPELREWAHLEDTHRLWDAARRGPSQTFLYERSRSGQHSPSIPASHRPPNPATKTTHKTPGSFSSSPQAGRRGRGPARRSSSAPTG
jgi:hypothetical protein